MPSKSKQKLERVSMNLPASLVNKVKKYADETGLNVTSAYIVLLGQALRQNDAITQLPLLLSQIKNFDVTGNNEYINGKEEQSYRKALGVMNSDTLNTLTFSELWEEYSNYKKIKLKPQSYRKIENNFIKR